MHSYWRGAASWKVIVLRISALNSSGEVSVASTGLLIVTVPPMVLAVTDDQAISIQLRFAHP
jgi:hypothetical protein